MATLQRITFLFTIIILLHSQNKSFSIEKKFKIISEETPIHSFYENPKTDQLPKPKIIGSDIEIISKIFDTLKIPYEIELVHWTQVLPMLKTGEADMALGIQKNSKYDKYVDFTRTPMRSKTYSFYGLSSQLRNTQVMTFEDALEHNFSVGIIIGFTYPKEFWDTYPFENRQLNSHLVESRTFRDNMIKLKEKKIDLFIADRERVNVILKKVGADETIFQYKNVLYWKDYFFVFSKKIKDPKINQLKTQIDRELYKMTESDAIPEINLSWIKKGT